MRRDTVTLAKKVFPSNLVSSIGPILRSKGMCAIFHKKGKKMLKKGKKGQIFENLGKNVKNLKNILKKDR